MSTGRGRGYTGRHHLRDPRPGEHLVAEERDPVRTYAELGPHPSIVDPITMEARDIRRELEKRDSVDLKDFKLQNSEDEEALKELLYTDEKFMPILQLLEQFSPGEDGIQFNRKLKQFVATLSTLCPDELRLQQAFATLRAASLLSSVTARKLAAVGVSFTRQQRQLSLRSALLNIMQATFAKLDVLEKANPLFLINAANLMGDYFAEARLCNGNRVHILAGPLLKYIKSLLATDDIRAHRSLATQLMQNGRELLTILAPELDELCISIRLRLLSKPPVSIIWLLLSADLCLNKFLPLPHTLQQFYAAHLELATDDGFSEVSYGSWKSVHERENKDSIIDTEKILGVSQLSLGSDDDNKPKLRPILGAGAGLLRQELAQTVNPDIFDTWTNKSSLAKRYDLNSWRQVEEDKKEEEPIFNPSVLPPNLQYPITSITVPDYPPPNFRGFGDHQSTYLLQGDGPYIQNQFQNNSNFTPHGDQPDNLEKKPIENWRKDSDDKKPKNWSKARSKDDINDNVKEDKLKTKNSRPGSRMNRRNSGENSDGGVPKNPPPRRHVTDVPRSQKYWDHDDRCDKDYNS